MDPTFKTEGSTFSGTPLKECLTDWKHYADFVASKAAPDSHYRRRNAAAQKPDFVKIPPNPFVDQVGCWCPSGVKELLCGVEGEPSPLSGLGMEAAELLHA